MRDKGTTKGKPKSVESADPKPAAGAEGKTSSKPAPMTAKEKIAANQKNKRRK
jgi:hypothetical protein